MSRARGRLRIIGGQWRSRLIDFDPGKGEVRPTPDRVRQTLFDWLSPLIEGARCVDLYAGSGALGFEALSRGAAQVTFIESGATQVAAIRAMAVKLAAEPHAEIVQADVVGWLRNCRQHFDIAFVDPPYAAGLLTPTLHALAGVLSATNRVYVEWPVETPPDWPPGWQVLREKAAGQVSYALASFELPERFGSEVP